MEEVNYSAELRKKFVDAAYLHTVNTGRQCVVALTHPETFNSLLEEIRLGVSYTVNSTLTDGTVTTIKLLDVTIRRCPDVKVGEFEIY